QIEADTKPDARAVAAGRTADADRNRRALSRRRVITALKSDADLDWGGAFTRAFGSDEALQLQLALNRHAITVPFKRRLAAGAHGGRIGDRRAVDDIARPRRPARWRSGVEARDLDRRNGGGAGSESERGGAEQNGGKMAHHEFMMRQRSWLGNERCALPQRRRRAGPARHAGRFHSREPGNSAIEDM